MACKELVTCRELVDWMTQQLRRRYHYPDAKVDSVEKLPVPDSEGCNWRPVPAVSNASVFDVTQVQHEARRRFNLKN